MRLPFLSLVGRRDARWLLAGCVVYATPAVIRAVTGTNSLPFQTPESPILAFPYVPSPGGLVEKLLVNFIAPGGVGAVFWEERQRGSSLSGRRLFLTRLTGSVLFTIAWSGIQLAGFLVSPLLSFYIVRGTNPFEGPAYLPLNLLLGSLWAPWSPYLVQRVGKLIRGR